MIYAYNRELLYNAQQMLGWMLHIAVNIYKYDLKYCFDKFVKSEYSYRFGVGDTFLINGMSGHELALALFADDISKLNHLAVDDWSRSKEYWTGWSVAYYQWLKNVPFSSIPVQIDAIANMYDKYHEMDLSHFVEEMDRMISLSDTKSNLSRLRTYAKLSQSQLSDFTNIPIRTIQQYEQRQKNINHARADYVIALSQTLHCKPEELFEIEM